MGDFKVRCVKVFGHQETQKLIEEAFQCLKDQKLLPLWFSEDECFTVKEKKKNEVYIFDVFEGEAFEHISGLGARILGPMCVITSLACKKDIPRTPKPIYNLAMKDIIVCCTNIDRNIRDKLHEKVEWMGGTITRDLTGEITHLVAGSVGSPKYLIAGEYNKQIMLPTWVDEVWKKSKLEAVHGTDELFQDYRCPIFMGHVVTVSGLTSAERAEAKKLIEKEGGVYSGEMKAKECTHLITNDPKGQKYNFALKWEIHVVKSGWLYDSIEKGFCQDEKKYPVDSLENNDRRNMKTSTPERRSMAASDITDINNISMISMAHVNETACSTFMRIDDPTENLDVTKAPEDLFLDGCKIFLSGFRGATLEKLRKIINSGGGTRFNQITDNLTHVVIGEKINNDIEMVKSLTNRPHTVTSQWLVDCFKQGKLLEETQYYSPEIAQPAPKTPEIKGGRKKSRAPQQESRQNKSKGDNNEDDVHDIMSQYLENQQPNTSGDATRSKETTMGLDLKDEDLTQDPNSTAVNEGGIFGGKSFVFYGFNDDDIPVLSSYIKENGGTALKSNARRIPDYAIVPIDGFPVDRTVKDIATNVWLQMCIEQNVLLDVQNNPLFTPIELDFEALPLKNCILSVSGYLGTERDCLVSIADLLGAKTQEYFVRQAKNDFLPSTHLVVNAPEGSKYQAAKKWGIPAVSKLWILACAKTGKRENEEKFLIDTLPDSNINLNSLIETQFVKKDLNKSENQSRKSLKGNQSLSSNHSRKSDLSEKSVTEQLDKESAQDMADAADDNQNNQSRRQSGGNETSHRDFSTMGDTEAILAGLNTQGEQETVCDNNEVHNIDGDETVAPENNISKRDADKSLASENNVSMAEKDVEPIEIDNDENEQIEDQVMTDVQNHDDDDDEDNDDEMIIVNKNLQGVKHETRKSAETPPLTRFRRNLEKNPAKMGTPALAKQSVRDKLLDGANIQREYNVSMETPPLTRFVRKLDKEPAKVGTPSLTEMSARERLMGKGYQSCRTIERKKNQDEQRQSQKENFATPVQSNRVKELQGKEVSAGDKDTPSKFLNPNVRYIPKFDTEELLKSLETPEAERSARAKNRKDSLDDDELYELAMRKTTKNLAELREARLQGNFPASQSACDEPDGDFEELSSVLGGVVITVGKKLTKDQAELHDIVESLGGDYRWNYDKSCTHFIFQGRQNDTSKEFKHAKTRGMKIVSPHWLYMCKEQNAKVDESLFPHTFNPNLSLSVVSTRRTPMRTPRSSRRIANKLEMTPAFTAKQPVVIQDEEEEVEKKEPAKVSSDVPKKTLDKDFKSPEKSSEEDDKKEAEAVETGGSLEMREVLSKQLEDVMSKGKKRRKSKKLNCSGQVSTPEEQSGSKRRTQENVQRNSSNRSLRSMADEVDEDSNSADVAPSQSVHVGWDDPMSRLEQAKLAHKLERANSPTQEVGGMYGVDDENAQYSESDNEAEVPVPPFGEQQYIEENTTPKPVANSGRKKTPTPEGPSIAFPTSNKSSKVTPPKPIELEDQEMEAVEKSPPVFMLSGMLGPERDDYGALIEQLGGTVLDTGMFDDKCTHLVINRVTRNEKFLASIASGKWVLHKSYFEACRQEQRFVEEDFYEWGSEGTLSLVKNMESNVRLLAAAARDWRIKIQKEKLKSPSNYGAFCTWRVLLNCDRTKESNYKRLLVAGGATVLNIKPPYSGRIDATHALLDFNKAQINQEDMEKLISSDCLCLKVDYISGYLCNPNIDITDYVPAEISALQTVMSDVNESSGKKRKASSGGNPVKRSKRK